MIEKASFCIFFKGQRSPQLLRYSPLEAMLVSL